MHCAYEYFQALRSISPAQYEGYFRYQHNLEEATIISSSPELFFKLQHGKILCSPIKGTRARSPEIETDLRRKSELLSSDKDLAELAMIVEFNA